MNTLIISCVASVFVLTFAWKFVNVDRVLIITNPSIHVLIHFVYHSVSKSCADHWCIKVYNVWVTKIIEFVTEEVHNKNSLSSRYVMCMKFSGDPCHNFFQWVRMKNILWTRECRMFPSWYCSKKFLMEKFIFFYPGSAMSSRWR